MPCSISTCSGSLDTRRCTSFSFPARALFPLQCEIAKNSTFSRRRIFGYLALVLSLIATAFIGFGLWVHHMFATPLPNLGRSFFTASSMMIAIPNGIQIFCWIATLWGGRPRLRTPLWFVMGFFFIFMMGGLTGVI